SEIAKVGGGRYLTADNAIELTKALAAAATGIPLTGGGGFIPARPERTAAWMIALLAGLIGVAVMLSALIAVVYKKKYG
ncbi:MAG: hypothetical protein ABIB93_01030, partial [Chloroflexota bacterium]